MANKEEYATWINQYDPLKSRRDALDTEIKNVYAAAVAKLVPLLHQLAPLNNDISQWCRSKPSGHLHDGDKRWLSAIPTPHDLKLPNPDKPTVNLWPPAPHNYGTDNLTPILGSPGNEWWKTQQAEGARARIEDAKRADALETASARPREAAARDGDGNMRSGRKNARGAGRTKEWNAKDDQNGVTPP